MSVFEKSLAFFGKKISVKAEPKKSERILTDSQVKALLRAIWSKRANSFFDGIQTLPEFSELSPDVKTVEELVEKGLVKCYGIENDIYEKRHLIVTISGIEALLDMRLPGQSITPIISDIMIDDKIRSLNRTCRAPIKKEYSILLLALMYFNRRKDRPLNVSNPDHRRYFMLALNEIGKTICTSWTPLEEKNFYQKFYNEVMVVYYQTSGVFRYSSVKRDREARQYAVEERDERQLGRLCFKVASSLTSKFKDEKTLQNLADLSKHFSACLRITPLPEVPLSVEDMLRKLGIRDFDLRSKRKRVIEEVLGRIAIMKENFHA